jgi:asparagine synthase (glutamine-hydrolysing)
VVIGIPHLGRPLTPPCAETCGAVGDIEEHVLARMTSAIAHRGRDDSGLHRGKHIDLGVRRLRIIEVSGGHQPIANENGSVAVVFNGEIYNDR